MSQIRVTTVALTFCVLGLGSAATAAVEGPLNADLVGAFAFGPCPASAPAGARCLHDRVTGTVSHLGEATGEFDVVLDAAATGADGCAPADKRGSFVAANGDRLTVVAKGRYCFATSVTTYTYAFTGGSGRFADATGTGSWFVPAPRTFNGSKGEGDERLRGSITFSEPDPIITPEVRAQLRFGGIVSASRGARPRGLRARIFSNLQPLRGVVVTVRRGSARGRVLGRSGRYDIANSRVVTVRVRRGPALRRSIRYVAVAVGRDQAGRRISTSRAFRLDR